MNRTYSLLTMAWLLACLSGMSVWAQSNASIRLAILGGDAASRNVLDLLTVELSQMTTLTLLERSEIDRLYREQQLSYGDRDYLKLGQVLGADGILLLTPTLEGTNQFMQVRLIAVRPGVVLAGMRLPWPVPDAYEWSQWLTHHFKPLFSKLSVPTGSAIPISVVNLRATVQTADAKETERQINLLATERLTRERELFVLERRRMDLLTAEKELSGMGDSAFWKGSFLLEGTIDRDGFEKEAITLDARLVPPQGGVVTTFSIRGPRAKLGELVEKLTSNILEALRKPTGTNSWQADAEATKYFDEAKWALKWGMIPEAQAAAESAWALGKRDTESAALRIRAYLPQVPPSKAIFQYQHATTTEKLLSRTLELLQRQPALVRVWDTRADGDTRVIKSLRITEGPDIEHLTRALHILRLYTDFLRDQPITQPKVGQALYHVGVETLTAVSQVLQAFNWTPPRDLEAREHLAELRRLAREVAHRIETSPSVRDSYWVGNRIVSHDELADTMAAPNIYRCTLQWSTLWQERPEDSIAVYRRLIESPVFSYIHDSFWLRDLANPRVIGWTSADNARAASLWNSFLAGLNASPNFLLRMEAKALEIADAKNDAAFEAASTALFEIIQTNRSAIVSHSVEIPYLKWGLGKLFFGGTDWLTPRNHAAVMDMFRDLDVMRNEWWAQSRLREKEISADDLFEKQKDYLREHTPYDLHTFRELFSPTRLRLSKAQAEDLLPLLANYKSNLVAVVERSTGEAQRRARSGIHRINAEEQLLRLTLVAPPSDLAADALTLTHRPPPESRNPGPPQQHPIPNRVMAGRHAVEARRGGSAEFEIPAPLTAGPLLVDHFIVIPQQSLNKNRHKETIAELRVVNSRVIGDRLWFDLLHKNSYTYFFTNGSGWTIEDRGISMFCTLSGSNWEQIPYPKAEGKAETVPSNLWVNEYAEMASDALYVSTREYLRRYDSKTRRWETFTAPWEKPPKLFALQNRLFGANDEALFEILAAGQKVDILASVRRRPAVTALDKVETLRAPVFFPGPDGTVRVWADRTIYSARKGEWIKAAPHDISEVWLGPTGTLLRGEVPPSRGGMWLLPHDQTNLVLVLNQAPRPHSVPAHFFAPHPNSAHNVPRARWNEVAGTFVADAGFLADGDDLYHYREYAVDPNYQSTAAAAAEAPHAILSFMENKTGQVVEVALKFDASQGPILGSKRNAGHFAPTEQERRVRLILTTDNLILGKPTVAGVWSIPRTKLAAAINSAKSSAAPPPNATVPATKPGIK